MVKMSELEEMVLDAFEDSLVSAPHFALSDDPLDIKSDPGLLACSGDQVDCADSAAFMCNTGDPLEIKPEPKLLEDVNQEVPAEDYEEEESHSGYPLEIKPHPKLPTDLKEEVSEEAFEKEAPDSESLRWALARKSAGGGFRSAQEKLTLGGSNCREGQSGRIYQSKTSYCSAHERSRFVVLYERGLSVEAIAEETGRHLKTVQRWVKRYEEEGEDGLQHRLRSGRKPITSTEEDAAMVQKIRDNPFLRLGDAAEAAGAGCSPTTVARRLKNAGLKSFRPFEKPILSDVDMTNRSIYANRMLARPDAQDYWMGVVFTDEKIFCTDNCGRVLVRRPLGMRHLQRRTVHRDTTARSGRNSLHVWGWIDSNGNGEITRIQGRHTAETHVSVLDEVLLPTLHAMRPGGTPYLLQQDNRPQNTARVTRTWLQAHQDEITPVDWPAKSPDISIMEDVWALLANQLNSDDGWCLTADELWVSLQQKWEALRRRSSYFEELGRSMLRRLEAVRDAHGGYTF